MSITRIDCQFYRPPELGESAGFVALNPSQRPGSLVFAGAYAARGGIGSQVASKLSLEHFISGVLDYFGDGASIEHPPRDQDISLDILEAAFRNANSSVYNFGHRLAAGGRMAAAMLGLVIERKIIAAGRVGPSSAYLFRGGELFPFFESRDFGTDEASYERLLGAHSVVSVELASVPVQQDDVVLAFSSVLDSDSELQLNVLLSEEPLERTPRLVDYYMQRILRRVFADDQPRFAMVARVGPDSIYLQQALER